MRIFYILILTLISFCYSLRLIPKMSEFYIGSYIDHTVLKQTCVKADIQKLCDEAREYRFKAVCVPPYWIAPSKAMLEGSEVKIATVIGFPFGYSCISSKANEIEAAVQDGVDEVDIVANVSAIKNGDWDYIEKEIDVLIKVVRQVSGLVVKVIIESGVLTDEEIIRCCEIYGRAQIDYLKTSTGYADKGASVHAVQLFRKHLPANVQIKASGGIRTASDAKAMVEAGATRLGCSAGVAIVKDQTIVGDSKY